MRCWVIKENDVTGLITAMVLTVLVYSFLLLHYEWRKRKKRENRINKRVAFWMDAYDRTTVGVDIASAKPSKSANFFQADANGINICGPVERVREYDKEEFLNLFSELYEELAEKPEPDLVPFEDFLDKMEGE